MTSTEGGGLLQRGKATCPNLKVVPVAQGCHCLQHVRCSSRLPRAPLVSAPNRAQGFLAGFVPTSCLNFTVSVLGFVQWPRCFQKRGGTGVGLVHCSHRGFCPSSSPGSCHHCTACRDIPKPPSHSQIVFDSIMFLPLLFNPLFLFLFWLPGTLSH